MKKYLTKVKQLLLEIEEAREEQTLDQVPRFNNIEADALAKITTLDTQPLRGILKEILEYPSLGTH